MNELITSLQQWLPFLLPPFLGAVIGYVTNHVAIRMLFRPLKAWRVFGLRVPLTPGIIPSKRGELARKMGEMVGEHLLTSSDVGNAFGRESIRRELRLAVTDKLGSLLDRRLGPLETLVPDRFRLRFRELVTLLQDRLVKLVFGYLGSRSFEKLFRIWLQRRSNQLLARDLASFLTAERYLALQLQLDKKLTELLCNPRTGALVGGYVEGKVERLLTSKQPLRKLLPEDLVDILLTQLEQEVPPLAEKFASLLYDPDFRAQLVKKGKQAIDAFLDSLGGLAGLLSGFVDLDKLYDKIPEFLDKAGEELAAWLKQETTRQQLAQLVRERAELLLERSPASFTTKLPYEKVAGIRRFAAEQVVGIMQSPRTIDTLLILSESAIDHLKHRTFAELLECILPEQALKHGRDQLAEKLLAAIRSDQARGIFTTIVVEQSEDWIYRRPLGQLSARLPGDVRQELESGFCQIIEEMLRKEAPRLVETLNVQRMVEEKVNSLDLLQVEGLLMGIMKEQFKYINLFGALLGMIIGLINLLILQWP